MIASVIIPTLNRARQLSETLGSLVTLDFDANEFEIIVVDNGSSDHTKNVVDEYCLLNPDHFIRYFFDDMPGLLTGRHRGAKEANGELFVFIDDDIRVDKYWLTAIAGTFDRFPEAHLVGGKCLPLFEKEPPQWLDYFWETLPNGDKTLGELSLCDFGNAEKEIDPILVWGLNFSIRKASFYNLGGFNPDIVPVNLQYFQGDGETGLSLKMIERKYKAFYNPKALIYHQVTAERMTISYFEKRKFYQGVSNSYSQLRRNGRISALKPNIVKQVAKIITKGKRKMIIIFFKNNEREEPRPEDLEKQMLVARLQIIENAGYKFHQAAALGSTIIMDWILRENYFDYELPARL